MVKKFESGTIRQTLQRLHEEGYHISESALRVWVKSGLIPANYCGIRAYLYYPNVIRFLQQGSTPPAPAVSNGIRKIG